MQSPGEYFDRQVDVSMSIHEVFHSKRFFLCFVSGISVNDEGLVFREGFQCGGVPQSSSYPSFTPFSYP